LVKSIATLVDDIYGILTGDHKFSEDKVRAFSQRLSDMMVKRLSSGERLPGLSLSQIGEQCDRKSWYDVNSPPSEAEPLEPQARFKFLYGDILEELTLFLAEEAGHDVQGQQDSITVNGVVGHRDAVIDGVLVDVKSANSRGFVKFKTHNLEADDPFGYLTQAGLYLHGSVNDDKVKVKGEFAFVAVDKELGAIVLDRYRKPKSTDYDALVQHKLDVVGQPDPPPRGFSPVPAGHSGNLKLATKCKYCKHKAKCYPETRKFLYSNGVEYLTKVVSEPRVDELIDGPKGLVRQPNRDRF